MSHRDFGLVILVTIRADRLEDQPAFLLFEANPGGTVLLSPGRSPRRDGQPWAGSDWPSIGRSPTSSLLRNMTDKFHTFCRRGKPGLSAYSVGMMCRGTQLPPGELVNKNLLRWVGASCQRKSKNLFLLCSAIERGLSRNSKRLKHRLPVWRGSRPEPCYTGSFCRLEAALPFCRLAVWGPIETSSPPALAETR